MAAQVTMAPAVGHLQSTDLPICEFKHPLEALRVVGSGYNIYQGRTAIGGNKRLARLEDAVMKLAVLEDW
jgi:hypothetical protein